MKNRTSHHWSRAVHLLSKASCSLLLVAMAGCDGGAQLESSEAPETTLGSERSDAEMAPPGDPRSPGAADDFPSMADEAPVAPSFTAERLEQLVAPVALYPDPLLMEVLMAATYPSEVAEAAAWRKTNPNLNGKELDAAVADKGWDVSVNSLTHATQALELMAADPAWTKDLGDAFLAQQDDVLNAVQIMRSRACDLGNLKTTEQQQVIFEDAPATPAALQQSSPLVVQAPQRIVRVVPVQPQIVHVPVYNPMVMYGPPPPVVYYPGVFGFPVPMVGISPIISFGVGLAIGSFLWGDYDWYDRRVYRRYGGYYYGDYYRGHYPDRFYDGRDRGYYDGGSRVRVWHHNPQHRRDVSYRSSHVERYYRSGNGSRSGGDFYSRDGRPRGDSRDGTRYDSYDRQRDASRVGSRDGARRESYDRQRDGSRDGARRESYNRQKDDSRSTGDSRDGGSGISRDRGPGGARDKAGMSSGRQTDGRVDDRSRGPSSKSPGVSRAPSSKDTPARAGGSAARPDSKSSGKTSARPPSGGDKGGGQDKRGSVQRPSGSAGGSQAGRGSVEKPSSGSGSRGTSVQKPSGGSGSRAGSVQKHSGGGSRGGSVQKPSGGGSRGGSVQKPSGGGASRGSSVQRQGGGSQGSRGGSVQRQGGQGRSSGGGQQRSGSSRGGSSQGGSDKGGSDKGGGKGGR